MNKSQILSKRVDGIRGSMQKELVKQWVSELRSGQYTQGTGELVYNDDIDDYEDGDNLRYCCLGVAAVHVLGETVGDMLNEGYLSFDHREKLGLGKRLTLEEAQYLNQHYGLNTEDGTSDTEGVLIDRQEACVRFNDNLNKSFSEIADIVEKMGWDKG